MSVLCLSFVSFAERGEVGREEGGKWSWDVGSVQRRNQSGYLIDSQADVG